MDSIDATTLQVGFGIFFILVIIFALFLRKISVGDIMTPPPSARSSARQQRINKIDQQFAPQKTTLPSPQSVIPTTQKSKIPAAPGKPILGMDRKKVNIAGKVIGAIGVVMLFAPLPESFTVPGMVIAYIGYMIAKASAPPKEKKQQKVSPQAQKIRQLASQPLYEEALKLLVEDYNNKDLTTETAKFQRAVQYLTKRGIQPAEAKENLGLLLALLIRQKK